MTDDTPFIAFPKKQTIPSSAPHIGALAFIGFNGEWLPLVFGALHALWDKALWDGDTASVSIAQEYASQLFILFGEEKMAEWVFQSDSAEAFMVTRSDGTVRLVVDMASGVITFYKDGGAPNFQLAAFNNTQAPNTIGARLARGTEAAPEAALSQDTVLQIAGQGHTGSGFPGASARIRFRTSEAQSPTARGMQVEIETTPKGTNAVTNHLIVGGVANVPGIGFLGAAPVARQVVTGSRGGNAALASLLQALANLGLIDNQTTS